MCMHISSGMSFSKAAEREDSTLYFSACYGQTLIILFSL